MMILHNDAIQSRKTDATAPNYGADRHVPTAKQVKVGNRWRRVYRCESNSYLNLYIVIRGANWELLGAGCWSPCAMMPLT